MAERMACDAPRPSCTCVAALEAELRDHGSNTAISTELFSGAVVVATVKADERLRGRRGKPHVVIASHCPFCGVAYRPAAPGTRASAAAGAAHVRANHV